MSRQSILRPNPGPQALALSCPIQELGYGGARGGGKGIFLILDWLRHASACKGRARGLLLRKYLPDLRDFVRETKNFLPRLGWTYKESEKVWVGPDGSELTLAYLEREEDAERYQGWNLSWLAVDEAGQYGTPAAIDRLRATLRLPGVPRHDLRLTFNPGGPGHSWLKARFVDPAPPLTPFRGLVELPGGQVERPWRVFIPAKITDNPYTNTAEYRTALAMSGNANLVKAWLEGDWNIVAGGMFDDVWSPAVVREPEPLPPGWRVTRSFDWGSSHPFAVVWWAEADGTSTASGWCPKRGSLVAFAEWYGWNGKPNEGARMLAVDVARGILDREKEMRIRAEPGPADSAIYAVQNGNCIADDMARLGCRWVPAEKGPGSRVNGWEIMRKRLRAAATGEDPALYVFATCRSIIRTIPTIPRDPKKPDDVDTDAEDHCLTGDTLVYTTDGFQRIDALVGRAFTVEGHDGHLHPAGDCRMTQSMADIVRVTLQDGGSFTCTPDHLLWTADGWKEAKDCAGAQLVSSRIHKAMRLGIGHDNHSIQDLPGIPGLPILPVRELLSKQGHTTSPQGVDGCQRANPQGIPHPPSGWGQVQQRAEEPHLDISERTPQGAHDGRATPGEVPAQHPTGDCQSAGMAQVRGGSGMAPSACREQSGEGPNQPARKDMRGVREAVRDEPGQGQILQERMQDCGPDQERCRQRAETVPRVRVDVLGQSICHGQNLQRDMQRVVAVTPEDRAPVYNLEVPDVHSFAIWPGVYAHNCADAIRYRLLTPDRKAGAVAI